MSARVLLTGASGFVGKALVPILLDRGFEVQGLDRVLDPGAPCGYKMVQADLTDPGTLVGLDRHWDFVIHLAGATIPSQFSNPAPVLLNLQMTINLLEHLSRARVLLVSSCHVYAPSPLIRTETSQVTPQGLYGLSKHLVEQLAPTYRRKLDIRIARPFNHLGPGSPPSLVVPSLLKRLMEDSEDQSVPLEMQGRDTYRDFIDVRDVAEAYLSILGADDPGQGVFNVCTGTAVRISEVLQTAMTILNRTRPILFSGKVNSMDDNDFIVGDPTLLNRTTGWRSRYTLESSLSTMIDHHSSDGTP